MVKDWGEPLNETDLPSVDTQHTAHDVDPRWRFSQEAQKALARGDESEQKSGGFKQKIIVAITARDVDLLTQVINELDIAWMHPKIREEEAHILRQKDDLLKFFLSLERWNPPRGVTSIYMSGGGASRLLISVENDVFLIQPTENSSVAFKIKWLRELQ